MTHHTLILGFGNCLRADDGIGPFLADAVASWKRFGVRSLALTQLVPELLDELTLAERVLFIDAGLGAHAGSFRACRLEPAASRRPLGHHQTPNDLLAMTLELTGHVPAAWLLEVAAHSLDFGDMSELGQQRAQAALEWIRRWLAE